MTYLKMVDLDLNNKRVMVRVDLNVPMKNAVIENDAKIRAILPTLGLLLKTNASILLISHLGRPKEGEVNQVYSLKPIATRLQELMGYPIRFADQWIDGITIAPREIVLAENLRFNVGEESNDEALAKKMALLCDVFIMDAFGAAHRAHASTVGVAQFAATSAMGPLMENELKNLSLIKESPREPLVAIVGGAKISSKISVLKSLLDFVDILILGGGISNTLLKANQQNIGQSLVEEDFLQTALELQTLAKEKGRTLVLPEDFVVAADISETSAARITTVNDIKENEKILDVGPLTIKKYDDIIMEAGTILWNGPIGVFEVDAFSAGTKALSQSIAKSNAFSVAGGGETLAAIEKFGVDNRISYISTGGGAFLEFLEGKTLPAVEILQKRSEHVTENKVENQ